LSLSSPYLASPANVPKIKTVEQPSLKRAPLLVGWLLALGVLLIAAWGDPLSRTQEARVILGAREMLAGPAERWLIPTANGETRMRKPPAGYWASAVSMSVLGQSVLAGRLPAVLASWGTIGLTFLIGRKLFGERAGLYAAGMLLGSWLFFRHGVLAETDVLVMFGVTAGVYAILRARGMSNVEWRMSNGGAWLHVVAIAMAWVALVKGPPAGWVVLVMVAVDLIDGKLRRRLAGERAANGPAKRDAAHADWRTSLLWRFVSSGAIVTLVVIASPWFVYAAFSAQGHQLTDDLNNSARGGLGHSEPWWDYFPQMLLALLPWSFLWIVAGLASVKLLMRKDASDERVSMMIVYAWGAAVLVPLLAWGNKQPHYLMSLIPAMMVTAGWAVDRGVSCRWPELRPAVVAILNVMLWVLLIAPAALVMTFAWTKRPAPLAIDWLVAAVTLALIAILMLACWRWKRLSLPITVMAGVAGVLVGVKAVWSPTTEPPGHEAMARELRERYPDAKFVFRRDASLAMCVAMRRVIPVLSDEELEQLLSVPGEQAICLEESELELPPLPGYAEVMRLEGGENDITVLSPTKTIGVQP